MSRRILEIAKEVSKNIKEDPEFIEWIIHNDVYMNEKWANIALEEFKRGDDGCGNHVNDTGRS